MRRNRRMSPLPCPAPLGGDVATLGHGETAGRSLSRPGAAARLRRRASGLRRLTQGWTIPLAASILAAAACGAVSPGTPRSTQRGVFTVAQAARGKDVYLSNCTGCHNATTHTGSTFERFWGGHPLSEMYEYIGEKMPKNNPGTLSEQDTADLIAYLLQMNAMPPGKRELPPDSSALAKITFEVK